jgi:alpha-N-arabinofuranosidase
VLNTTGLVFKFYGENFGPGTIPLAVSGDAPVPELRFAMGAEHPLTVSGSPTYPLDVVAGLSPDRSVLRIAVVNAGFEPQRIALGLSHGAVTGPATVRTLTGASLEAQNRLGAAPEVSLTQSARARPRLDRGAAAVDLGRGVPVRGLRIRRHPAGHLRGCRRDEMTRTSGVIA